jgi:purine-cytosine permease-like protein
MLLEALGSAAAAAIHAPGFASATPAETIRLLANGNAVIAVVGLATVLIGTMSANALNLYSGALSALVAYDPRRRFGFAGAVGAAFVTLAVAVLISAARTDPSVHIGLPSAAVALGIGTLAFVVVRWTLVRWQAAIAVGALGGVLALAGSDATATTRLVTSFLGILSMWAAPWAGVLLAARLRQTALQTRMLAAWLIGIGASVPFWQQSWFTGALATAYPQLGDVSFFVAIASAFVATLALRRPETTPRA